jgi:hypothetical protein
LFLTIGVELGLIFNSQSCIIDTDLPDGDLTKTSEEVRYILSYFLTFTSAKVGADMSVSIVANIIGFIAISSYLIGINSIYTNTVIKA